MIRGLSQFISVPFVDGHQQLNSTAKNQAIDNSPVQQDFPQSNLKMLMFDGLQRRAQIEALFKPQTNIANVSKATATNATFLSATNRTNGSSAIDEETKRIIGNYRRQIKPSEIKGAPPPEGGKTPGHANSAHRVKPEVQAPILNKPDRIFSGVNDNNRYVDIYCKDGNVVITEFGNKESVFCCN